VLETATPGEEGFSSSALALMFTLGTALGAGMGGSIVALADAGTLDLVTAIGLVNAIMVAAAVGALAIGLRVPKRGAASGAEAVHPPVAGMPVEHP
jgi:hypothetical protein